MLSAGSDELAAWDESMNDISLLSVENRNIIDGSISNKYIRVNSVESKQNGASIQSGTTIASSSVQTEAEKADKFHKQQEGLRHDRLVIESRKGRQNSVIGSRLREKQQ